MSRNFVDLILSFMFEGKKKDEIKKEETKSSKLGLWEVWVMETEMAVNSQIKQLIT